jgi:mannose-1-phosphate guanylyltransferase
MLPALVLTAGLATRLRPLSFVRAKAALPVAGEPLVRRILRWLHDNGVREAVLNLHHLPHTLTAVVGDGRDLGIRVRYSWENPVLGSAGGPRRALPLLDAPQFLVVNGDTLTDLELAPVVASHRASDALVTMAVVPNAEPRKYSGLDVDGDGRVRGVVPRGSDAPSHHFFGVQVMNAAALSAVPEGVPCETVSQLYPQLIAERPGAVRAFHARAEYHDIGTPADYLDTSLRLGRRDGIQTSTGARTRVAPDARVERSILWDDVVVESGAMLVECIVADGVSVPADTSWRGVILRVADGQLAPGERRIGDLAISSVDGPRPPGARGGAAPAPPHAK